MKNGFIFKKAGFDENSVGDYINIYLPEGQNYNFGWGSLNQSLIKNNVPLVNYDSKVISVYQDAQGQSDLLKLVSDFLYRKTGRIVNINQLMLTNGATNGIFLLTHYFSHVDGRNKVLLQNPVYDTALNIFRSQGLEMTVVDPECTAIPDYRNGFAYLLFKFQNPTGISLDLNKKIAIVSNLTKQNNYVIEDDAYGLLDGSGEISLIDEPKYIYVGSFSKYIFPGLRLGYIVADAKIISELKIIQKYYNSHPNILSQYLLSEYLQSNLIESEIDYKAKLIQEKRNIFETNISKKILDNCSKSDGGFYYWLHLKPGTDDIEVFTELLKQRVVTIPGAIYFCKNPYSALRLSISLIDKEKIKDGCNITNKVLEKYV